ncbi:hypothetical protein BDV59DRAFT_174793, partial [Aspergillus ambiguus]|uniref:uncharacterized protein n=1 Tax=Aspergillus ambiguus TaxID=176160 RepID=UPI003CCCA2B5
NDVDEISTRSQWFYNKRDESELTLMPFLLVRNGTTTRSGPKKPLMSMPSPRVRSGIMSKRKVKCLTPREYCGGYLAC